MNDMNKQNINTSSSIDFALSHSFSRRQMVSIKSMSCSIKNKFIFLDNDEFIS
jgi:hypothetical protein